MKLIRLLLKISKTNMILAAISGLISGASSVGLIATINLMLKAPDLPKIPLTYYFAGLCCLLLVSTVASQALMARLAQKAAYQLQILLTQRILSCPLPVLEEIGNPRLLATLTGDVEAISSASFIFSKLCLNISILISCFLYLSWLSLKLFFSILIFMSIVILSQNFILNRGRYFLKLAREQQDSLFQHFQTSTEGIKELKLHQQRRQAFLVEDLQATAATYKDYRIKATDLFAIASGLGLLFLFVLIALSILVLTPLLNLPSSVLSSYVLTLIFTIGPLRILLVSFPSFTKANVALDKIEYLGFSLLDRGIEPELIKSSCHQLNWKSFQLTGVTHTYKREKEDSAFMLGPIDLTFYPGELVFIIGGNGSGKSTLVKLLAGLYIPETGTIQFDDLSIINLNREWYRQQFSVVFSDFYLFDRLLGLDNLDLDSQIQDYLVQLQLDHKVTVCESKLSTTNLSQGQRKRLALLTAYLEDRAIYIFDEWASDQDPGFKNIFYTQLLPELKQRGKTVIAISHDYQYFHLGDRLIELDYGKVLENKSLL